MGSVISLEFWRRRFTELAVAMAIVIMVIETSDRISENQKDLLPSSAWFEVYEIYVPDFRVDENPHILYDRIIHENFRGFFVVEVQRQLPNGLWFPECSGSGISDYEVEDTIPDGFVTWDWFLNRPGIPCRPRAGVYRLRTTYELSRPGWPVKTTSVLSNIFTIID